MRATLEDLELERWFRQRNSGEIFWTTKDGKDIPIKDMTDSHLQNTIDFIRRNEELQEMAHEYDAYMWEHE